jgi:hypothetical protein
MHAAWAPVMQADVQDLRTPPRHPVVLRAAAAAWPAMQRWRFGALAALAPDLPVQLVVGNREHHATCLQRSTLSAYLRRLEDAPACMPGEPYLKEFDLLKALPVLRDDLRPQERWPRRGIVATSAWIGPAHARTGLHHDLLDNLAVMVTGHKRFHLAPPGSVQALGEVSDKYDRWAVLARIGIDELHRRTGACQAVDLAPGDALLVPRGWWHEVVNLTPSILLGGFFGSTPRVLGLWAWTGLRHALHLGGWRRTRCCCHDAPLSRISGRD